MVSGSSNGGMGDSEASIDQFLPGVQSEYSFSIKQP
jgi:hypothetical protein